jgi:hypothetical protein
LQPTIAHSERRSSRRKRAEDLGSRNSRLQISCTIITSHCGRKAKLNCRLGRAPRKETKLSASETDTGIPRPPPVSGDGDQVLMNETPPFRGISSATRFRRTSAFQNRNSPRLSAQGAGLALAHLELQVRGQHS